MPELEPAATTPQLGVGQSQSQIAWKQFRKHKLALVGSTILILLALMALFAPFLAPYGLNAYSRSEITRYQPPTPVQWYDPDTGRFTRPFIYTYSEELDMETFDTVFTADTSTRYPLKLLVKGAPYKLFGFVPGNLHLFGVDNPARIFLMGADNLGRDLFSRILYAAQISLSIGVGASILSFFIGIVMGALAGYYGGWIDELIMRLVEVIAAIPALFLLLSLRAIFPIEMNPILLLYIILMILAVIGWGDLARVVRGQFLSTRELDYVTAARSLGASNNRIIFRHLLPSVTTYMIVSMSLAIPGFILAESGLSFLGVGVSGAYASWGSLLSDAQAGGFASITSRPWVLIPGLFIVLTITSFQLLGDGLRDAFDPRKRQ